MFFKMVSCEALKPHVSEEVPIGAAPLSTNSINQLDTCFLPHVHLVEPETVGMRSPCTSRATI